MIIDCISDLHGFYPKLEGGDLLIVAGDLTARDIEQEYVSFLTWANSQDYQEVVFIGGNHDNYLENDYSCHGHMKYLCDSGTEFEGLKIWGSPWTNTFEGMNPHCKAFTYETEEELAEKWTIIPSDTDILITHSPPFTILDETKDGRQVGSLTLMAEHLNRLRPKLWVFGHIHEAYGIDGDYSWNKTKYVNASHVNEYYQPVNKPVRVIL